jgi:hypothetical protein
MQVTQGEVGVTGARHEIVETDIKQHFGKVLVQFRMGQCGCLGQYIGWSLKVLLRLSSTDFKLNSRMKMRGREE